MQLVEPKVISKEEKILFHSMNAVLEPDTVKKIFWEKYKLELLQKTDFNEGDIVIFDNQVAFRLAFDAHVSFSILIDRSGKYIGFANHNDEVVVSNDNGSIQNRLMDAELIRRREKEIVNAIASPINKKQLSEIFEKENGLSIGEGAHFKDGQIISYNNKVVYKLDFNTDLKISLLIDRHGGFLSFTDSNQYSKKNESNIPHHDNTLDDLEDLIKEDDKRLKIASA
jgi:hypothetical protein